MDKHSESPTGQPLAVDQKAVSASSTEPAFIARPLGAPAYYGFEVIEEIVVDGFVFGKITDFEAQACDEGDGFLIAPDNSRAGLVWRVAAGVSVATVIPFEQERWGVWDVSFPVPMSSRENLRRNLELIVPLLKPKWLQWREKFGKT